jgi:predicted membrane-bound mannosyltransferase
MSADTRHRSPRTAARVLFILALAAAAIVGTRSITDERAVSLQGDMPRYLMDGVFLRDLAVSHHGWSVSGLEHYATEYYARYPALSIGHHPPGLAMVLAASFTVFGVSVWAARLAIVALFLVAVLLLYLLTRRLYDEVVAGWAALLFATQPYLGRFGQSVLSEVPAIALVLAAVYFLVRFRASARARDYFLFVAAAMQ